MTTKICSSRQKKGKDILLSEIFVDDIIFRGQDDLCKDFSNQMKHEFEMSMFGEIKFLWNYKYIS